MVALSSGCRTPSSEAAGLSFSIEQDAWSTATFLPTSTSAQPSVFRPEVVIAGRGTKILIDLSRYLDLLR